MLLSGVYLNTVVRNKNGSSLGERADARAKNDTGVDKGEQCIFHWIESLLNPYLTTSYFFFNKKY